MRLMSGARSAPSATGGPPLGLFGSPAQSQGDCWTPVNQDGEGNNLDPGATVAQL